MIETDPSTDATGSTIDGPDSSATAAPASATPASATPTTPSESPLALDPRPGRAVPWPPRPDQRGLSAPYPPGGLDPTPDTGHREERYYLRLLLIMVVLIVVGGLAISVVGSVLGIPDIGGGGP